MPSQSSPLDRIHAFLAFAAYLAFVVYGSLIPFDYHAIPMDQAIARFQGIGYLNLGVGSRADWVANIVLYVPLAFLACVWLLGIRRGSLARHLALIPIFLFCIAVAIAVEFTQQWFAPRTVSMNDLLAETLGSAGGIALWVFARRRVVGLVDAFAAGGRQSVQAAMLLYALLYVAMSLFPYDFLISTTEIGWKFASGHQGWLLASGCGSWVRCGAHLIADLLAIAPLGLLATLLTNRPDYRRLFLYGVVIGIGLEAIQFLLASGSSQGLSVVMRGLGLMAGAAVGDLLRRRGTAPIAHFIRRVSVPAIVPYVLALAALGGWFSDSWGTLNVGLERLAGLRLMPFYYHYYTSEPVAMASLLANSAMYAPVGLAIWAWRVDNRRAMQGGALLSAILAAAVALPFEMVKLLLASTHPDLTNLLIAAVAAAATYLLADWLHRVLTAGLSFRPSVHARPYEPVNGRAPSSADTPIIAPVIAWSGVHPVGALIGVAALLAALYGAWDYPMARPALVLALVVWALALWRHPLLWLPVIPTLLPTLDLSPLTGTLTLDEFDLLVLVTLAVLYFRVYRLKPLPWPHPLLAISVVLLWLTWSIAMVRGLQPLWNTTAPIMAGSHTPLEAWRVGKGLLWALLLIPILRRVPGMARKTARRYIMVGWGVALAIVSLVILWQRWIFVGLGDFDNVYRVTGTFSAMRTGGAYIEAFIAFSFPVLAVSILIERRWALKITGILLATLASYAMLVTFSRGGYAGLAVGLSAVAIGAMRLRSGKRSHRWAALIAIVLVTGAIAVPILGGGFAQQRLAIIGQDFATRIAHWRHALNLMDDGPVTALTGMGFGRYPYQYLLYSGGDRKVPGNYVIVPKEGNPFLRLGGEEAVYLDQWVDMEPATHYRLSARVRGRQGGHVGKKGGNGTLSVPLCEKALLYSFQCLRSQLGKPDFGERWQTLTAEVDSMTLGKGGLWPHRPVKLSLYNPDKVPIDIDDIHFIGPDGIDLLANGDFADGDRHWLFVTDRDLAWHIHQTGVEVYFAQGWIGLLALASLSLALVAILAPAFWAGIPWAIAFVAGLLGFFTVSLLGSTLDSARIGMLFYFGATTTMLLNPRRRQSPELAETDNGHPAHRPQDRPGPAQTNPRAPSTAMPTPAPSGRWRSRTRR